MTQPLYILLLLVFCAAAYAVFCTVRSWATPEKSGNYLPSANHLPDHDLKILLVTPTSTKWEHSHICTECHSPVGHEEFMTMICLTCGRHMRDLPYNTGLRKVVRRGRWVRQQTHGRLELRKGVCLTPSEYDSAVAKTNETTEQKN